MVEFALGPVFVVAQRINGLTWRDFVVRHRAFGFRQHGPANNGDDETDDGWCEPLRHLRIHPSLDEDRAEEMSDSDQEHDYASISDEAADRDVCRVAAHAGDVLLDL